MKRNIFVFLFAMVLSACSKPHPFSWLKGTWSEKQTVHEGKIMHESWRFDQDGNLSGVGYEVIGADTNWFETFSLKEVNGKWLYCAMVKEQHGDSVIEFELNSDADSDSLVFRNPENDFPSEIIYVRKSDDHNLIYLLSTMGPSNDHQVAYHLFRQK